MHNAIKTNKRMACRLPAGQPLWSRTGSNRNAFRLGSREHRRAWKEGPDVGGVLVIATLCICRRQCGVVLARATRRAATGN